MSSGHSAVPTTPVAMATGGSAVEFTGRPDGKDIWKTDVGPVLITCLCVFVFLSLCMFRTCLYLLVCVCVVVRRIRVMCVSSRATPMLSESTGRVACASCASVCPTSQCSVLTTARMPSPGARRYGLDVGLLLSACVCSLVLYVCVCL